MHPLRSQLCTPTHSFAPVQVSFSSRLSVATLARSPMCAAVAVVTLGMLTPYLRSSPSRGVSLEALVMRLAPPKPEVPVGDRHGGVTDARHLAYRRHSARRGAGCRMGVPEPAPSSGILLQEATPEMLADVALLRTKIFYPEMLESPYNKYLQAKSFVEAMQKKTAVLVALAPHADADDDLDPRKLQERRSAMATVGSADLVIEPVGGGGAPLALTLTLSSDPDSDPDPNPSPSPNPNPNQARRSRT